MLMLLAMVLAQTSVTSWSSGRPPECSRLMGLDVNVWDRAKAPELREYCDLVASASSKLSGTVITAETGLEIARRAEQLHPGGAAARAIEGRALVALGQTASALVALREASTSDSHVLDDPPTLLAWARALARTGHSEEASAAYRALLPRSSSLGSADRAAAALEAGLVAMSRGPSGLDEAVAALRGAMEDAEGETTGLAVIALALVRDRGGAHAEAQSLLANRLHGDPRVWLATPTAQSILSVAPLERSALLAIGLERAHSVEAREAWQEYLAKAPDSPWAAHARQSLEPVRATGRSPGLAR
jgi:tetratricopeptide (TPR) repeat protein